MHAFGPKRDYSEFWAELELNATKDQDIARLKAEVERAIAAGAVERRAGERQPEQVFLRALRDGQCAARGGIVFRVFWWGFHLEIPSPDLNALPRDLSQIVGTLEAIAASAPALAPHLLAAVGFMSVHCSLLKRIDDGRGVYVGMLWNAPGSFVPTPVR
ncbi:MAG TPA: hypothetical protein VK524_32740 [Polyangiaceae bacterium]|nr:hypothetical protein [Polyangiaceae bacterium]